MVLSGNWIVDIGALSVCTLFHCLKLYDSVRLQKFGAIHGHGLYVWVQLLPLLQYH